jgi:hypothetical protein
MGAISTLLIISCTFLLSCSNNNDASKENAYNKTSTNAVQNESTSSNSAIENTSAQQGGIVGEWEQQFTCHDKNNNYTLEADERNPAPNMLGFDYFRFNADGSCVRDKDIRFKGTYEIVEKGEKKKLLIHGGDKLKYNIESLTNTELVLGMNGAFMVFRRK